MDQELPTQLPNINQVALSGRLVAEPVLRHRTGVGGSVPCLYGRLATRRTYRDPQKAWVEETSLFDVKMTGPEAELIFPRLQAETFVYLTGSLSTNGAEPGTEDYRAFIEVRNLQVLTSSLVTGETDEDEATDEGGAAAAEDGALDDALLPDGGG